MRPPSTTTDGLRGGDGEDKFLNTHVLDVLLYRFIPQSPNRYAARFNGKFYRR